MRRLGWVLVVVWATGCNGSQRQGEAEPASDALVPAADVQSIGDAAPASPDADASTVTDAAVLADGAVGPDAGVPVAVEPGPPLPAPPHADAVEGDRYATSAVCAQCHENSADADAMRDAADRPIGAFDLWQSSMMANSARDPIWRAVMSAEVAATPTAKAAIEAKCTTCHAPMAWREVEAPSAAMVDDRGTLGQLARDGVSCTLCHSISPQGLGTEESFTGGFVPAARRVAYGPHQNVNPRPMMMHTDVEPAYGQHILDSALCGSCHTVKTHSLDADGQATGHELVEQGTFLEWRSSQFAADGQSCQGCHLPTDDADGRPIDTAIARNPGGGDFGFARARRPYGRHVLVGGNTLVPRLLRDHRDALRPQASDDALRVTEAAARAQLQRAATLAVAAANGVATVTVRSAVGHKLPSGIPTRRAWLRITVLGADDAVLLDSGAFDERGRLQVDGAVHPADLAGGPFLTHTRRIAASADVVVYESIMCDAQGEPTWRLLRGATYCKDNRLLPRGWRADHADGPATAPAGVDDPDFVAGGDAVEVVLPEGARRVEAALYYQPLGARFLAELSTVDTAEVRALLGFLDGASLAPEEIARASLAL